MLFCHDFILYTLETKKEVDSLTSKMTSVYDIKNFIFRAYFNVMS